MYVTCTWEELRRRPVHGRRTRERRRGLRRPVAVFVLHTASEVVRYLTQLITLPLLQMATDTIRADSESVNPNPRSKNRARTRARHPQRAPPYARARYPRVTHARGHARTRQA